jgi:hypothetical protein
MRAKSTLLILASAAGALALAVAAATSTPVQTWAAWRLVPLLKRPGASVGTVTVRVSRASLTRLHMEMDGAVLDVPSAQADLAVIPALYGKGYRVRGLSARGWTLDLTHSRSVSATAADGGYPWFAQAVGGVLAAFNVRANLSLESVDLEGDVVIPDQAGRPGARAHVVVTGGGLGEGRDGRFLCAATATVSDPAAPVSSVTTQAVLTAAIESSGVFTRAELKADATARGPAFPNGVSLACAALAARGGGKESYSVSLIRGSERIAAFDAEGPDGSVRLAGTWRLDLRDTDLAPFALGRSLPAFFVAGEGLYDVDPSTGDVHATGKLHGYADRLGVTTQAFGTVGRINLAAEFDVAKLGASFRVARLEAALSGAAPFASVQALQTFEFNPNSGELKVAVPSDDLVGIAVKGFPLSWLKGGFPSLDLAGGDAKGEFVLRAEEGRLVLRTKAPLISSNVSIAVAGRPVASGLELSAFVLADYAPQGWQFQVAPFAVRSEGLKMLSVEARIGRLAGPGTAVKAAGSWSASLPVLFSVPLLSRLPRLSGGEASGSFEASLDATRGVRVKVALKDLASGTGLTLPAVTSELRADFDAKGGATFSAPARLDYGTRTADLVFLGTVVPGPSGRFVEGTLSGTQLLPADLAAVAFLLGGAPEAVEAPSPAAAAAATSVPRAPFWPAVHARLALKFESVSVPHAVLRDVRGTLLVEPAALSVTGGTASLGDGGAVRLDGQLSFARDAAEAYTFRAAAAVDNVESAPLFRSLDPERPPVVEGRFDVAAHLTGSGATPSRLLDKVQGDLKVSSKGGRFRALRTDIVDAIKVSPSKIADAIDTVSALFGKKSENLGSALVESARELSEIHYDQMSVVAERGPDLDLRLTELTLIAPEARLTGSGRITYAEAIPVQDQALSVDIEMGVRGRIGKQMDLVGLLKEGQDELGYAHVYQPVHLGGTLRNVDQSQWREMLLQALLRKGGGLFDKLMGK